MTTNNQPKPLLVLFDGNALVHRAYHALPPLTNSKTGETLGAVYGFVLMLLKVLNELKATCYAVAFDRAAPTFRHQLYDQYKIQRPATPPELITQLNRVRQLVTTFNIPVYELDGYEADDILGTLSRQAAEQGIDTVIVTGDADSMQLVAPQIRVLYPRPRGAFSNTMLYNEAAVREKYGVRPDQIADFKALVGDTSDNIPGVRGIGEKTAVKLIGQFGSAEEIYRHIDKVDSAKIQALLRENEAQARQSKKLATIVVDAPVTLNLEDCQASRYDRSKVVELFRELEFYSLLDKLPEPQTPPGPAAAIKGEAPHGDYRVVDNIEALDDLLARLSTAPRLAFDLEGTSINPMAAQIVGLSIAVTPGQSFYIPVGHRLLETRQLPWDLVRERLAPVFADSRRAKIAHNANYDWTLLAENGVEINNLAFDTQVAAHLLGEKSTGLKSLAFTRLNIEMTPIIDLIGTGHKQKTMAEVEISQAAQYCGADSDMTLRLADILGPELKEQGLWPLFTDVEMPLIPVLIQMQRNGVALDTRLLSEMSRSLGRQMLDIEAQIYNFVGHQFNINSPQQLSAVLFQDLKLPPPRKTRGVYSTGAGVLDDLRGAHPIVELILDYRQLAKLKSTYIDALPGLVNPRTGRVHTNFNQTRTATGRLSSSDPNLQNIPVRGELGKKVRTAFYAPAGSRLLAGDYSQIDLRALAHLSRDEGLVAAFRNDEDIHAATAAQLFNVDRAQVVPDMRRVAKTVNFGVIYGISEYGLEQATELSREEASRFIAAYFARYPAVKEYLEATKRQARTVGYVQTLLGRRRTIPEIHSSNRIVREAAERMAINMPVQGTSADIIKVAMDILYREMSLRGLKSKLLLQVHDELVFEVPENELALMREMVPDIMATAVKLMVPLKVDIKEGANWGEME